MQNLRCKSMVVLPDHSIRQTDHPLPPHALLWRAPRAKRPRPGWNLNLTPTDSQVGVMPLRRERGTCGAHLATTDPLAMEHSTLIWPILTTLSLLSPPALALDLRLLGLLDLAVSPSSSNVLNSLLGVYLPSAPLAVAVLQTVALLTSCPSRTPSTPPTPPR